MAFNVGDVVEICGVGATLSGSVARVECVLPNRLAQDFQEYIVEFPVAHRERFRFCLFREFELRKASAASA